MIKKSFLAFAGLLLLVGAGCGASVTTNGTVEQPATQPETEQPAPAPEPESEPAPAPTPSTDETTGKAKVYAMTEVAVHKDASSCWTVVNDNVYDVTAWIGKHPGGTNAILALCGKDGSALFNAQHGGSAPQESTLASYKIGTLKK